jgi:hypothetical protein
MAGPRRVGDRLFDPDDRDRERRARQHDDPIDDNSVQANAGSDETDGMIDAGSPA